MKEIHTTLKNFSFVSDLNNIFPQTEEFEFTKKGVIRAVCKPNCKCGKQCIEYSWLPLNNKFLANVKGTWV